MSDKISNFIRKTTETATWVATDGAYDYATYIIVINASWKKTSSVTPSWVNVYETINRELKHVK